MLCIHQGNSQYGSIVRAITPGARVLLEGAIAAYVHCMNAFKVNLFLGTQTDGSSWFSVGQSVNMAYVSLFPPKDPNKVYASSCHLGCWYGGATTGPQAIANTWSHFSPLNVRRWNTVGLYYYRTGRDFSQNGTTDEDILHSPFSTG